MSLTFFHPYSIKSRYLTRKPMEMDFDEFYLFPNFFDDCLNYQTNKLQLNNQLENNENFVTKIKLDGFDSKDINLELSRDKRRIKVTAKNENKTEKDGFRSYTLKEFSKELSLPDNIDVDKLKSVLNERNELVISAPKLLTLKEKEEKNKIKIQMETPKYEEEKNTEK